MKANAGVRARDDRQRLRAWTGRLKADGVPDSEFQVDAFFAV